MTILIRACPLPGDALLAEYARQGAYTDCYTTTVTTRVSQRRFVEAFYTTRVFKLERLLLSVFAGKPSKDEQARSLAAGDGAAFAAWSVERREPDQLLMSDYLGRTRSWLMSAPTVEGGTRLFFGSAVAPSRKRNGTATMGVGYRGLLGFHKLYSRILLRAAVRRLRLMEGI